MRARLPVTAILGACLFLAGISAAAIAPYRAIVAVDGLGLSNGAYALVMTLAAVGAGIASPVLGIIADKLPDRRYLVLICGILGGIAYGLIYLRPNIATYVVVFCVLLPFGGALFTQTLAYSRAYYDARHPVRAEFMMSALRSLFSLAWVVAPPIVGFIASTRSVFSVFAAAALAHGAFLLMFLLLFLDPDARTGPTNKAAGTAPAGPALARDRLVGIAGVLAIRIALVVHVSTLPLVLTKDLGGSLTDVGINASIAAAAEVPFMLAWGWAATRLPKEAILIVNGALYAAYLILVYFARSVTDVLVLQGLNALATAALLSITISYLQESIRGRLGLSTSLIDVMTVLSGFAAAGLFALFAAPAHYSGVLLAAGALSLCGAIIITLSILIRRPAVLAI